MNYRSTDAVLAVASSVLGRDGAPGTELDGRGRPGSGATSEPGVALVSRTASLGRATPAGRRHTRPMQTRRAASPRRSGGRGAQARSWSSLAVLARTNAQLVLFERELEAVGIPFVAVPAARSSPGRLFATPWTA